MAGEGDSLTPTLMESNGLPELESRILGVKERESSILRLEGRAGNNPSQFESNSLTLENSMRRRRKKLYLMMLFIILLILLICLLPVIIIIILIAVFA